MKDHRHAWEELLNPEVLRAKLISASLYLSAFEVLKQSVVGRLRDFFCSGFGVSGDVVDPKYQAAALSLAKNPLDASLQWLYQNGALDASDLEMFKKVRSARNVVAHKLQEIVAGEVPSQHTELFPQVLQLLRKVETWWILNVEIPTDPDYNGEQVGEADVEPGRLILLQLMQAVAAGDASYLDNWRRSSA